MGDDAVRHALLADHPGERPGVDPGQADHAAALHPTVQVAVGPPVGRRRRHVTEDRAPGRGLGRAGHLLQVFQVGPHIAHMGEGEGDDLGHVGGVGEDLLVAGHGGVETHLAHRRSHRPHADPLQHGPVRQDQHTRHPRQQLAHDRGLRWWGRGRDGPAKQTAAYLMSRARRVNATCQTRSPSLPCRGASTSRLKTREISHFRHSLALQYAPVFFRNLPDARPAPQLRML